jgi:lysylphosphatidylglycerol synthetase-like protein (DUF2156 family)
MRNFLNAFFGGEKFWRFMANFWTIVAITVIIVNFISHNRYENLFQPTSVIYAAVLSLYVGTKEFERWYQLYEGRHPGEWFVMLWTAVMLSLVLASFILGGDYKVSSETVANYIVVISIYAVTQQSKRLYKKKRGVR